MVGIASECSDPDLYVDRSPGTGAARNKPQNVPSHEAAVNPNHVSPGVLSGCQEGAAQLKMCSGGTDLSESMPMEQAARRAVRPRLTHAMNPSSRPTSPFSITRLKRSYAIALSLIAALGIAAASIFHLNTWNERDSATRTNVTGWQRTLTQRVITEVFRVATTGPEDSDARRRVTGALAAAVSAWNAGFAVLLNGSQRTGLQPMRATDVAAFDELRPARERLAQTIASFVRNRNAAELAALADSVNTTGLELIVRIDGQVQALAARQGRYVQMTQRISVVFVCVLLLLLGLEVRFVFQPATRAIGQLIADQDAVKAELYAKAEEMYASSVQQEIQNDTLLAHQQTLLDQQEELMAQQSTLIEQRDHLEQRASELSRLTAILDATPDAVAVFSLTGEVLYANAAAELNLQHVRRRDWTNAAHLLAPASVRLLRDVGFPHAIRRGLWQGEVSLRDRGGRAARTMVHTLITHRDANDRVASVTAMLQDITEQKALQVKLAEGDARNRSIVEALAEGVMVQDETGRVIHWNSGAQRILGLSADQLAGRTPIEAAWRVVDARGETLPSERHPISRARLEGTSIDGEVMGVHRGDGTLVWLSVNARAMTSRGAAGTAAAVATFTDITRSLAAARELETLSVVARQTDHGIVMTDRTGCITWVNAAWEELSGYTRSEVEGRNPADFLHGTHSRPESIAGIEAALATGQRWNGEILYYRPDGTPYWIELDMTPSSNVDGGVTGFIGLIRDITTRRKADRERQQLAAAMAVTADGIAITGVSGALEFVNHAFARMHGYKAAELLQTPWAALYEAGETQRLVQEAIPEVTQVGFWQGEATGRTRDGVLYPQELSLTLLPHGGLVAVARDIADRKLTEERLKHLSVRDELTSLYNRRGFLEQADTALKLSARQGVPCALLYGDLDSFKSVNDGFGHNAGDAALQTIAGILTTTFRETDLVARLGGDEFTMLAIGVLPDDVARIIDRINDSVDASNAERLDDAQSAWHLGISLGVAFFDPDAPEHVEMLLRTADEAQYQQKRLRKAMRAEAA